MHELSIAVQIVESLEEELAAAQPDATVASVKVTIGAMSGVVPEALTFCWDAATDESRLAGSRLEIEFVAASVWCAHCEAERTLTGIAPMLCPVCARPTPDVRSGRELEITSVELLE